MILHIRILIAKLISMQYEGNKRLILIFFVGLMGIFM
jgi:hypothetical protein